MLWLNGGLVAAEAARIDPADRGFTLGDGVFETLLVRHGTPQQLDRHLARLAQGASILGLDLPYGPAAIATAIDEVLAGMETTQGDSVVRITLTRGPAPRGLAPPGEATPTMMITAAALPPPAGPARAIIARTTRRNDRSPISAIKSLNYADNILARREAIAASADEAILLNTRERVACATVANVFAVIDGVLVTPPVTAGALPGVRRALLLEQGYAIEREITEAELKRAGEIILTNSLGLRSVISLNGVPVGDGTPGKIYRDLP